MSTLSFMALALPANILLLQVGFGPADSSYFVGLKLITVLSMLIVFFGVVAVECDSLRLVELFPTLFAAIGATFMFIFGFEVTFHFFAWFSLYVLHGGLIHIDSLASVATLSWVPAPSVRELTTPLLIATKWSFSLLVLSWYLTNKAMRSMKQKA